jgi:hypothetical protein
VPLWEQVGSDRVRRRWTGAAVLCAALLVAGCGGPEAGESFDGTGDTAEDGGDAAEEATEVPRMPDVLGMHVDEATAELEAAGFTVGTGVVRTTEMDPDLVYRSEPAPGQQVREGQRVTLRVAAEPRG